MRMPLPVMLSVGDVVECVVTETVPDLESDGHVTPDLEYVPDLESDGHVTPDLEYVPDLESDGHVMPDLESVASPPPPTTIEGWTNTLRLKKTHKL